MGLVTEVNDDSAPTVLIVDNNPMSSMRLSNLFKTRNFSIEICNDGDQAVDDYIRLDPELVVLSLDIPSLDGHLAALEMREHGGEQRIMFVAPRRMADVANNAAYSAGAVAWLQKPISNESLEAVWEKVLGTIPEAPGLEDLDQLYPDRVQIEEDSGPMLPELPLLPLPDANLLPELPLVLPVAVLDTTKPKRRGRRLLAVVLMLAGAAAGAYYSGYLPV